MKETKEQLERNAFLLGNLNLYSEFEQDLILRLLKSDREVSQEQETFVSG